MPANLTPEYKKAEDWYRNAGTDSERLLALEEMLRTIPKHKGTEHMRADIKRRMSKLRATLESGAKKGGAKHVDVFHVPKTGAGQVALIGLPNCGKSALLAALSNAKVQVADYPFSSDKPVPGMIRHEDVQIEMVDMPPITADYAAPGQVNTYRHCDLIAIVVDLAGDVLEQLQVCLDYLDAHRLILEESSEAQDEAGQPVGHKAFVICTKVDAAPPQTTETLRELCDRNLEFIEVSATTGQGLEHLTRRIFEMLDIVRVYAKKPGEEADMKEPFTLPRGATVMDLAVKIHRELAQKLKSARAWNSPTAHDGQNIPRDHVVTDKEIIELHFA
ncbi:MAG TPA: TGS domain-containing protein [Phycisphaerales bacterium]|nr:TGS domain-containing protein [Phycisphaerales bacterium]